MLRCSRRVFKKILQRRQYLNSSLNTGGKSRIKTNSSPSLSDVFVKGEEEEKRNERYHYFLSDCLSRGQTITGEHPANYLSQLDRRQKKKKEEKCSYPHIGN
ncbi:unnamed protein product [Tenebrio molitor]|nr:unnamed protein product [Tenebrio molitor]